jgi:hypothetical protein
VNRINAISCPSTKLCIAVTNRGDGVESTDPAGGAGAWRTVTIDRGNPLYSISCPSVSLCVAVAVQFGTSLFALSSTQPTSPRQWTRADVADFPHVGAPTADVSCPSTQFCVMADNMGNAYISRRPTTHAWSTSKSLTQQFNAISCASSSLCVAVDDVGNAFVLTS